jgi:hypothetical protein
VPIHPDVAARLPLLMGIPSFIDGFADPAVRAGHGFILDIDGGPSMRRSTTL